MPATAPTMLLLGIVFGLLTAVAHSAAFAMSRRYIVHGHGNSLRLMVISHVLMGPPALVVLAFFWGEELRDVAAWGPPMLAATFSYLSGQALFLTALRHSAASRLVPLLGLKVVAVVPFSYFLLPVQLGWPQAAAVLLSLSAGAMLHHIGGRLPWRTLVLILIAVSLFALSDVSIVLLVRKFNMEGNMTAATVRSVGVCYGFCGVAMLALLPWVGSRRASDWSAAVPQAACWLPSMYFLFACLALCGPVLGNIVIGTRGLFAIGLGAILAARGMFHLEHHASRGVVVRRFAAAALMIVAIALYGFGLK